MSNELPEPNLEKHTLVPGRRALQNLAMDRRTVVYDTQASLAVSLVAKNRRVLLGGVAALAQEQFANDISWLARITSQYNEIAITPRLHEIDSRRHAEEIFGELDAFTNTVMPGRLVVAKGIDQMLSPEISDEDQTIAEVALRSFGRLLLARQTPVIGLVEGASKGDSPRPAGTLSGAFVCCHDIKIAAPEALEGTAVMPAVGESAPILYRGDVATEQLAA